MLGAMKTRLLTSAADILATPTLKRERVPTPELGEGTEVLAQELTIRRRMQLYEYMKPYEDDEARGIRWQAALVVLGVIDEQGQPVFALEQVDALGDQSPTLVERISDVVGRLSGFNRSEAERPFDGTPNDDSPSDSPESSG